MSTPELLEKIEKTAYEYEKVHHGCSQCVLRALQEHLQLGDGGAFKASSALAGGVARMGEICGALSGGIMAIGLRTAGKRSLEAPNAVIFKRLCLEDFSTSKIQRNGKNL